MVEEWKPIQSLLSRYEASSLGRIRSVKSGQIRKPQPNKKTHYHYMVFQEQVADWAVALAKAQVLVSNADVPLVHRLYCGRYMDTYFSRVRARRAINCKGNGRGPVGELLMDSLYSRRTNAEGPCTLTA